MHKKLNKLTHASGALLTMTGAFAGVLVPLASVSADEDVSSGTPMDVNASSAQIVKVDQGLNDSDVGSVKGEPLYFQDYDAKVGNSTYRAYCLQYSQLTPSGTSKNSGKPSANEYKVLLYGFPNRTPEALGAKDFGAYPHRAVDAADRATQIVMWIEAGDFSFNDVQWGNDGFAQNVKQVTQNILNAVNGDHSDPTQNPSGSLKVTGSKVNGTSTTVTFQAAVSNDQAEGLQNTKFNVQGLPSGSTISQDGKTISNGGSFDISKPITVTVPGQMSATQLKASWSGQTQHGAVQAAIFGSPAANQQSSIVYHYGPWNAPVGANVENTVMPTEGALHIHKVDSSNKPVAGVKFALFNGSSQVATATTDSQGNVQFNNLAAGQYTLKELDAPIQVKIDHASMPVTVAAGQTQNDNVTNTTVTGNVTSVTVSDDGLHMDDAIKGGNLDETLNITNAVPGVDYRQVTKVVHSGSNTSYQVNGKDLTAQSDQTANSKSFTMNVKLPIDRSTLEGQALTTETTLYRVKGSQTLQLAQETNNNDPNQTVSILKPTVSTIDSVLANGKAGNQTVNPSKTTVVTDSFTATNLIKGHKYTADFVESINGKELPIKDSKTFTATGSTMTISDTLPKFDSTKYAGQTMTIHSDLKGSDGTVLATHNDDNDKNEQIHVTKPTMQTMALIDGGKESNPNGASTLYDEVSYNDVAPGQPLNFKVLARKPNGQPIVVTVNGKQYYLEGNINYTPSAASGEVDVPLMEVPVSSVKDAKDGSPANTAQKADPNSAQPSSKETNAQNNPNGGNQATTDKNGLVASNTNQWTDTTADQDAKYITIKPIQAGLEKTDPNKAAQEAGDNNSGVDNPYDINTRSLAGQDLGLAETMNSNDTGTGNGWTTEAHHDAHDSTNQAVHVTNPKLHTEALLDGGHSDMPSALAQLFDKVSYSDVVPGKPLEISATMYDKNTKEPETFKVDGKTMELVGRETFIPKTANGTINVPLQQVEVGKNFNATDLKLNGNTTPDQAGLRIDENPLQAVAPVVQAGAKQAAQEAAQKAVKDTKGSDAKKASAASSAAQQAAAKITGNNAAAQGATDLALQSVVGTTATTGSDNGTAAKSISGATPVASNASTNGSASQVAKDTNSQLTTDGVAGTADATKAATGDTKATMIDTRVLAGKSMVAVEDLSEYTNGTKRTAATNWITSEADLNNNDQTVNVTKPEIHTKAAINGAKNFTFVKGKKGVVKSVTDTVMYKNFVPGKPQKVTVVEMNKATGKPVQINGKYLVGQVTFTPKTADGNITVQEHLTSQKPAEQYLKQSLGEVVSDNNSSKSANSSSQASSVSSRVSSSSKAESSIASSKETSSAKASSSEASSMSSHESQSESENNNGDIDLSSIGSKQNWVNFETTQNVGQGNNVTAEGKNLNDQDESVGITPTTPKKASSLSSQKPVSINIHQEQAQSQKGATATANAQGGKGANGGQGGTSPASPATANGTAAGGTGAGGAAASPRFAQTGGTRKIDKVLDFFYKWF